MHDCLAQHALAFAMDEDNLLSFLLLILLHGLLEYIHLIMKNIGGVHAGCRLQHLVGVEVDDDCAIILLRLLLARIGYDLLVLIHLLLQAFGIHYQWASHLVVLHDGIEQGWRLEEVVLLEEVQLVELHWVKTELHVGGWLQEERLVLLEGNHLDGYVLHFVELLSAELLDEELGVRLYFAFCLQGPGVTLSHEISVMNEIVAIVHHVGLEASVGHVLDVHRHEGEVGAELVASGTLLHRGAESNLTVGCIIFIHVHVYIGIMLVEDSLDASAVAMQLGVGMLLRLLLGVHLGRNHLAHGIVVLFHDHHFVDRHRNLESVLVFHQHNIFALEASDLAAAHFAQESYFISFFHLF